MQLVRKQYGEIVRDREAEEFAEAMGGVTTGFTPRVREIEQAKDEKEEAMSPASSEVMSPASGDSGGKENARHKLQAFSSVDSSHAPRAADIASEVARQERARAAEATRAPPAGAGAGASVESEVFDMDDIDVRHLLLLH